MTRKCHLCDTPTENKWCANTSCSEYQDKRSSFYKLMVAVEYIDEPDHSTFEIFESIDEAFEFAKTVKYKYSFIADFNLNYIWQEENSWNYDDNSELYNLRKELDFTELKHYGIWLKT